VADLGALASHWQAAGGWSLGDFTGDGSVDVADLGLLATNWQAGVSGAPTLNGRPWDFGEALSALGLPNIMVPEPSSLSALGLIALVRRRRAMLGGTSGDAAGQAVVHSPRYLSSATTGK
jgi:hypothetical protein